MLLLLLYAVAGYWAVGRTIYANKVVIGTWNAVFMQKAVLGFALGWALIPIALIKLIFKR